MTRHLFVLIAMLPQLAFAWSETGHSTVCEIAYAELSRDARREVDRLIKLDADYDTFAESCNWADGPPRQRDLDHYVNFPRSTRAVTEGVCKLADTCIFSGIDADASVLLADASSDQARLDALKLLGHWVADIHQPMHTAFSDDRGANSITAIVVDDEGEEIESTLHGVWDYWIIHWRLGDDYRVLANRLRAGLDEARRDRWRYDLPVEWANESFQLAISPETRYCVQQSGACWYSDDNMTIDPGEPRRVMPVGDAYAAQHAPVIERRLLQAGVRLGYLLNQLLAQN